MPPVDRKNPKRADSSESDYTLMDFMREYPDDDACLESLWVGRYSPDGEHAMCPGCEEVRTFKKYESAQQRQAWNCVACGHYLYPTAGTVFHKSSTSLHLWFYAMYLMTSTRCGISAKQLERELGVTYKTAWRMAHRIRTYLMTLDDFKPVSGQVEADEAWIGGRRRYRSGERAPRRADGSLKRGRRTAADENKTAVFGIVERKGRVFATPVPNVKRDTVVPHIIEKVLPESTVYTDEYRSYLSLPKHGYEHRRIHHRAKVYVSGDIHTNTIEGFWSLVKRGIGGVYHAVSAKHLQGYLNEYAWRYNLRGQAKFEELLRRAATTRVA